MGDFGMVVVPRDGADTERIMNHSSVLRKFKVDTLDPSDGETSSFRGLL